MGKGRYPVLKHNRVVDRCRCRHVDDIDFEQSAVVLGGDETLIGLSDLHHIVFDHHILPMTGTGFDAAADRPLLRAIEQHRVVFRAGRHQHQQVLGPGPVLPGLNALARRLVQPGPVAQLQPGIAFHDNERSIRPAAAAGGRVWRFAPERGIDLSKRFARFEPIILCRESDLASRQLHIPTGDPILDGGGAMQRFCRQLLHNPQRTIGLLLAANDRRSHTRIFQSVAMLDSTGQHIDPPQRWMIGMVEPRMAGADACQNHALVDLLRQVTCEQHPVPRSVVIAGGHHWLARRIERHSEVTQRQIRCGQLPAGDLSAQIAQNRRRDAAGCHVGAAQLIRSFVFVVENNTDQMQAEACPVDPEQPLGQLDDTVETIQHHAIDQHVRCAVDAVPWLFPKADLFHPGPGRLHRPCHPFPALRLFEIHRQQAWHQSNPVLPLRRGDPVGNLLAPLWWQVRNHQLADLSAQLHLDRRGHEDRMQLVKDVWRKRRAEQVKHPVTERVIFQLMCQTVMQPRIAGRGKRHGPGAAELIFVAVVTDG